MPRSNPTPFRAQLRFLRRQFLQDGELPFTNVLTEEVIARALAALGNWLDRIFSPLVTLWVFLGQVLSADHSCRAAVARLLAHRLAQGQSPCSPETGAYCQARQRLPESFFADVARHTGQALDAQAEPQWLWKRRRVYIYDGPSVSMPDTPKNQAEYPQPDTQKPGLGFPLARIAAIFSLACGAVLDVGVCRYAGKGQSELGLLRTLWGLLRPGDVLLADRLMCAWAEMVMLKQRGVDSVCRLSSHRAADFRRGKRLGPGDHLVKWARPMKPRSLDRPTYEALPEHLMVRECRVRVEQPGFRVRGLTIATTLLDAGEFTKDDLATLYRARWQAEVDIRSIKATMRMDVLRCKTPEMVRKEIWAHLLAYNLLRTVMAVAAAESDTEPRKISFKGAKQAVTAFAPKIEAARPEDRGRLIDALLRAVAYHRVGDRPGRWEPRARKRRPERAARLMQPRAVAKLPQNRSKYF